MKKSILLLCFIACCLEFSFCSSKTKDSKNSTEAESKLETANTTNTLEGDWEIVKAEGSMASMNKGTHYIFEGTTFTTKFGSIKTTGPFTRTETSIVWTPKGMKMEYTYKFEDNQLIIEVLNSGGQKFWLDKK